MTKKQITKSMGYILIIVLIIINVIGCKKIDKNYNKVIKSDDNLSNNIGQLINEKNIELQISEDKSNYYLATEEFSNRIIELLSNFYLVEDPLKIHNAKSESYIILNFMGYDKIYLYLNSGTFKFESAEDIYSIKRLNEKDLQELWCRASLKFIDNQLVYVGFDKSILFETYKYDVDNDNNNDDVYLYYDGAVKLMVNEQIITVSPFCYDDAFYATHSEPHIEYEVKVIFDEKTKCYYFLVCSKAPTCGYTMSCTVDLYQYSNDQLSPVYDFYETNIIVKDYQDDILTLLFEETNSIKSVKLSTEEKKNIDEYIEFLKECENKEFVGLEEWLFCANIEYYKFEDLDNDNENELLTIRNIKGGASGIRDSLISVYDFKDKNNIFVDMYFEREGLYDIEYFKLND